MTASEHGTSRRRLLFAIKALASIAILVVVLTQADLSLVFERIRQANPVYLGVALLTPFLGYAITSIRWQGLLRAAGAVVPLAGYIGRA